MTASQPQKPDHETVEVAAADMPDGYQDVSDEYPAKLKRKLLLKMDVRIIPVLMMLYSQCHFSLANGKQI